jgi:hypothetical protein
MKTRILAFALVIASLFFIAPAFNISNAAPSKVPFTDVNKVTAVSVPITGTAPGGGAFAGTFDITRFVVRNGQLLAAGTLTGTITGVTGNVIGTVTRNIQLPVTNINGTCEILHLELGPLDLNLLGLRIQLNKVILDITAEQGALLGDLLCAIAGLLSGGGPLSSIANLLNQILAILG